MRSNTRSFGELGPNPEHRHLRHINRSVALSTHTNAASIAILNPSSDRGAAARVIAPKCRRHATSLRRNFRTPPPPPPIRQDQPGQCPTDNRQRHDASAPAGLTLPAAARHMQRLWATLATPATRAVKFHTQGAASMAARIVIHIIGRGTDNLTHRHADTRTGRMHAPSPVPLSLQDLITRPSHT